MSQYYVLADFVVGIQYFQAGQGTVSTADVGGLLPVGWVPGPFVDPLDTPAVNAFFAAGPALSPLIRQQFQGIPVRAPITYWAQVGQTITPGGPTAADFSSSDFASGDFATAPSGGSTPTVVIGANLWQLTGLGASLPAVYAVLSY